MAPRTRTADDPITRWRRRVWAAVQMAHCDPVFRQAMRPGMDSDTLAVTAWRALRAGHTAVARQHFLAALHHNPYNVGAWLGLSRTAQDQTTQRALLQIALDIHVLIMDDLRPNNAHD